MDAGAPKDMQAIRRAAQGLEATLVRRMLQAMEKAQLDSGLFGSSAGGKTRQTQFQMMLSEMLAEQEPFGIAEAVTRQLTRDDPPGWTRTKDGGEELKFSTPRPMSLPERTVPADLRTRAGLEERE